METNDFQSPNLNPQLIKVVIVEDHKVVAEGFEYLVNGSGIAQVIGKAHSVAGCFEMLAQKPAEVLLLDVSLPDGNGIDICPKIKEQYPNLKILMLTSYSEQSVIMRALKNGASGYILKNAMAEEIIEGIQTVAAGKRFLCDEVDILLKNTETNIIRLTRREQELLRLIVSGSSNTEIADSMCLGYETIKSYRKNLMLKFNVHNTAQLVKIATEQKYV